MKSYEDSLIKRYRKWRTELFMEKNYFFKWLKELRIQLLISMKTILISFLFIHIVLIQRYTFAIILPKYGFVITTEKAYWFNDNPKQRAWVWKKELGNVKFVIGRFYGMGWDIIGE